MALRPTTVVLLLSICLLLGSCGGAPGVPQPQFGTVFLLNQSDQGQAPLTVTGFFIQPAGTPDPGPNRLQADVLPGGVVIVGLFPPGLYDAVAVLETGPQVVFTDVEVRTNEPTNFIVPVL